MHKLFRIKSYERDYGPHFNEEWARKAVKNMQNEDGTRGPHWSIEETTRLAEQYGVSLNNRFNKYDWYVALNMVYSDYYRVMINCTNSNNAKHFVEFAKAWLQDKDIDEGKMWYYFIYIMCDEIREEEMECYEEEDTDYDDFGRQRAGRYRMSGRRTHKSYDDYEDRYPQRDDYEYERRPSTRYIRY